MSKPVTRTVSRLSVTKRLWAIIVLAVIVGAIAYPPATNKVIDVFNGTFGTHFGHIEKGFVLGLDLQGGTHLEYEADVSKVATADRQAALDGVKDVVERRVNTIGVSEPLITTAQAGDSWRVDVDLAGIRDVNQAINLIGATPILQFEVQNTDTTQPTLTPDLQKQMDDKNTAERKKASDALAAVLKDPSSFEALVASSSEDDSTKALNGDLGWIHDNPLYASIYSATVDSATGTVLGQVIETDLNYAVVKVTGKKTDGMEIRVSHILIQYAGASNAPTSTTMSKDDAKKLADSIRSQVTTANFADFAKKYSQEPGASQTGGDLGWFSKGTMVPEFEAAAFPLAEETISPVVETPYGFHIIYKTGERPLVDVRASAILFKKYTASDMLPPPSAWKPTDLTGKDLKSAQLDFDQRTGNAEVRSSSTMRGRRCSQTSPKRMSANRSRSSSTASRSRRPSCRPRSPAAMRSSPGISRSKNRSCWRNGCRRARCRCRSSLSTRNPSARRLARIR